MKEIIVIISLCVLSMSFSSAQTQEIPSDVTYQDLKNLGGYCEPRDTCSGVTYGSDGSTRRDFYNSFDPYCDCGRVCVEYDTCCVNSPYRTQQTSNRNTRQECVRLNSQTDSFFMVGKCSPKWVGEPQIRNKCHNSNIRDPYSIIPAFDRTNKVTYKNYFCGICNRVRESDLKVWNITVSKKAFRDYSDEEFVENLAFDEEHESWGHWEKVDDKWRFVRVFIRVNIPTDQNPKRCISNLVQNCDPNRSNRTIADKCKSYTAPVHATKDGDSFPRRYRNIHCVICNSARLVDDDFCTVPDLGEGIDFGEGGITPPISFAHLFDVNPKDGNQVGIVTRCNPKEVYDNFFHKCRSLVCGVPGYVMKNNKCTRS